MYMLMSPLLDHGVYDLEHSGCLKGLDASPGEKLNVYTIERPGPYLCSKAHI